MRTRGKLVIFICAFFCGLKWILNLCSLRSSCYLSGSQDDFPDQNTVLVGQRQGRAQIQQLIQNRL